MLCHSPILEAMTRPQLLSINIAQLESIPWVKKKARTGIFKRPVDGPVRVEHDGLVGDHIGSVKYHGGPDQAVYIYSAQDYAWWESELGRDLPFGIFGENLTVSDLGETVPKVGDRWQIGEVQLELSGPRIPCLTLAQRMDDPHFVKKFAQANRGGCYARVLQPGEMKPGDEVIVSPTQEGHPEIDRLFALWHRRDKDLDLIELGLRSPISIRCREDLEKWKARLS